MHRQPGECRRTQTETAAIRKYYFFCSKTTETNSIRCYTCYKSMQTSLLAFKLTHNTRANALSGGLAGSSACGHHRPDVLILFNCCVVYIEEEKKEEKETASTASS